MELIGINRLAKLTFSQPIILRSEMDIELNNAKIKHRDSIINKYGIDQFLEAIRYITKAEYGHSEADIDWFFGIKPNEDKDDYLKYC